MNSWEIVNEVSNILGISYRYGLEQENKYISLGGKEAYDETALFPLNITGFNTLLKVYNKNNLVGVTLKNQYITIDPDKETLTLYGYGAEKTISLKGFNDGLRAKYTTSNMMIELPDLTTTLQAGNMSIRLILQNYGFKNPEYKEANNQNEYLHIAGYALIKG